MEVFATIAQKVNVDPLTFIEKLIDTELGSFRNWIIEKDGGYYIGNEISLGSHSTDEFTAITKENYDYIRALELARDYLIKRKKEKHE